MDAGRKRELEQKVYAGERLDRADGLALYGSDDLVWLGRLAQHRRPAPERASFAVVRRLDLAGTGPAEDAVARARELAGDGPVVLDLAGFPDPGSVRQVVRSVAAALPRSTVTVGAAEARRLAADAGRPVGEILAELAEAGVDALIGDSADADRTDGLLAHRLAHRAGLGSVTILPFATGELAEWRVDHLLRLRELQDETAGFVTLVAVRQPGLGVSPAEALTAFAVARLMAGIPGLTCDWVAEGASLAQLALNFGVDDLAGVTATAVTGDAGPEAVADVAAEEAAEADSETAEVAASRAELVTLIGDAGFRPVERDARHRVVHEYDAPPSLADRRSEPQRVWT